MQLVPSFCDAALGSGVANSAVEWRALNPLYLATGSSCEVAVGGVRFVSSSAICWTYSEVGNSKIFVFGGFWWWITWL